MKCPRCQNTDGTQMKLNHDDYSYTCLVCGTIFRDDGKETTILHVVDKMIEVTNNLRSCIVTMKDGRAVTLSFPKDLEPKHPTEEDKNMWRGRMETKLLLFIGQCFTMTDVVTMEFDDEIEVSHDNKTQ